MVQIARRLPNKTWLRGDQEDDFLVTAIRRWRRRLAASVTQTSLSRWKCARKGRREGDNGQDVLRLPSVPFPWSLAVHNQSLAFRARLYDAKNEAPEEVAWFSDVRVRSRSLSLPSGRKVKRTANDLGRLRIRLLRRRLGEEDVKKASARAAHFVISLSLLHNYDVKMSYFTFYGGDSEFGNGS